MSEAPGQSIQQRMDELEETRYRATRGALRAAGALRKMEEATRGQADLVRRLKAILEAVEADRQALMGDGQTTRDLLAESVARILEEGA